MTQHSINNACSLRIVRLFVFTGILLLLELLLFGVNGYAQKDPQADAVLEKMASIINTAPAIYGDFEYHYQNVRTKEDYSAGGKIWIKGNRYRISLPDQETEAWFDGRTLWNYQKATNEVNVSEPDATADDFFMNNPLALFHIYKQDYKTKYLRDVPGTNECEVDLFPLDIHKPYHRIRLTLNKETGMLHRAIASGKNGETYEVSLKSMITNKPLEDSFFVFKKEQYPGIEVIDLRN